MINCSLEVAAEDIDWCIQLKYNDGTTHPVIVKLCRQSVCNKIYHNKAKLKGTKIIVRENLTNQRTNMVKELLKKTGQRDVFTNNGNVFIKISNKINKMSDMTDYYKILNLLKDSQ